MFFFFCFLLRTKHNIAEYKRRIRAPPQMKQNYEKCRKFGSRFKHGKWSQSFAPLLKKGKSLSRKLGLVRGVRPGKILEYCCSGRPYQSMKCISLEPFHIHQNKTIHENSRVLLLISFLKISCLIFHVLLSSTVGEIKMAAIYIFRKRGCKEGAFAGRPSEGVVRVICGSLLFPKFIFQGSSWVIVLLSLAHLFITLH